MSSPSDKFENLADDAYRRFAPVAARYYHPLRRPSVTCGGTPCMIFLGNHSSGKSSLINWVLGGKPVQDVGLAPTDDGFTVILYGETEEDVCGPAAVSRLPEEFREFGTFGDSFLQHLKVKVRNRELLKTVTLVDSPGMIDSADGTVSRTYDFEGVVKMLTNLCDVVFFLLDPDKPGTTGETLSVFAKCIAGAEFKLRVLLNKCDAFSSMYDFARTYGTTCWNLARVLHTKDLPKIWTIYTGEERTSSSLDLTDFNRYRREFLGVLHDAAARRRDNVYAQALADFLGLSIRMRVVNHAARRLAGFRAVFAAFSALVVAAAGLMVWGVLSAHFGFGTLLSIAAAAVTAGLGLYAAHALSLLAVRLKRAALASGVDDIFAAEYRRETAVGTNENLHKLWEELKDKTAEVVRDAPLNLPLFGEFRRTRLDKALTHILAAFHEKNRL